MNNLTAIILTKDEQLHIRRCLERICPYCDNVYIIDCFSTDETVNICQEFSNVEVIQHEWPGNQALQFNWALDNVSIDTEWIIRLDADEYLMAGEPERLVTLLPSLKMGQNALSLARARYFLGRHIKHGGTDMIPLVRVFRKGTARSEVRAMDEHIVLTEGEVVETDIRFADNNLNSLEWWTQKHLNYAKREAAMLMERDAAGDGAKEIKTAQAIQSKRSQKEWYARLPLFWRAFAYFCYRYFLRLGFLDGKEGFLWHFLQGWWYRTMVDAVIFQKCRKDGKIL
jgi:glycosyltransferase involved in cell wall biosynthesis